MDTLHSNRQQQTTRTRKSNAHQNADIYSRLLFKKCLYVRRRRWSLSQGRENGTSSLFSTGTCCFYYHYGFQFEKTIKCFILLFVDIKYRTFGDVKYNGFIRLCVRSKKKTMKFVILRCFEREMGFPVVIKLLRIIKNLYFSNFGWNFSLMWIYWKEGTKKSFNSVYFWFLSIFLE